MASDDTELDLDVLALTNGPDAIARHDGRAIFVAGAAPGDRVRARIVEDRGPFARAEVVARLASGPAYRVPPCPWVDACGGCPWQHVRYEAQLDAKAANVRETLARIAGIEARRALPILASPREWEYRHRIRLHVSPDRELGYLRPRSHQLVAIDACMVAEAPLSAALVPLRALVRSLATRLETVELATNGRGGIVVHAAATGGFRPEDRDRIARGVAGDDGITSFRVAGRGWAHEVGDPSMTIRPEIDGPALTQPAGTFTQVNARANQLLVGAVRALATPAHRILDLYCGAGNLSLSLARAGAAVIGVDRDGPAIAAATASARAAGSSSAQFEIAPAELFLRQQGIAGAELVVLDPPRGGAARVAEQLARLGPPRILYVSCDVATLARDARILAAAGYVVDRLQPIDFFPQTEHVEALLEAVRTPS